MSYKNGFTIVELLISMAIMVLLFTVGISRYIDFNQSQMVKQAALGLKSNLRAAVNKAISGDKPASGCNNLEGYEVRILANSYSYRSKCDQGSYYGTAQSFSLPSGLTLSPTTTILFRVLGRGADNTAVITVSGFGKTETVSINLSGSIE